MMRGLLDRPRPWMLLVALATLLTLAAFAWDILKLPNDARWIIADDARQFLSWTPRLLDPGALPGDFIADYWASVSPGLWRAIFAGGAMLGVAPPVLALLLPFVLFPLTAIGAWRLASAMTGRPLAAAVAAMSILAFQVHDDSIWSSTPRAFGPVLLLFAFDAMVRSAWWRAAVLLVLLSAIYPAPALTGLAMMGLYRLRWRPRLAIDLDRKAWAAIAATTLGVGVVLAPHVLAANPWGPTMTMNDAMELPNTGAPQMRSSIMNPWGGLGVVCNARMTFPAMVYPCNWQPSAALSWLVFLPFLVLALRAAVGPPGDPRVERDRLYLVGLVAALVCYTIALALAFRLHLPSRFSQRTLSILEFLALGQIAGLWLDHQWRRARPGLAAYLSTLALAGLFLLSHITPLPQLRRIDDPFGRFVAALPVDTRIAGVSFALEAVPALTGRAILSSVEHSVPWHRGYGARTEEALAATVELTTTRSPARFAELADRYAVSHVLLPNSPSTLERELTRMWRVVPDAVARAPADALTASAVARAAPGCTAFAIEWARLVDVACVNAAFRPPA